VADVIFEHLGLPDVSRTVGWFTSLFPLLLTGQANRTSLSWADKLKDIKEQIRRVPNKGLGFGLLLESHQHDITNEFITKEFITRAREVKPDVSFNYLGQFGSEASNKHFSINTYIRKLAQADFLDQSAALARAHALDIVIFVNDGCLQCDFLYDQVLFEKQQIENYLTSYQKNLENLINYCCDQTYSQLTPSDLRSLSLTQQEIENIEAQYQKPLVINNKNQHHVYDIESMHGLLPTQAGMLFHTLYQGA